MTRIHQMKTFRPSTTDGSADWSSTGLICFLFIVSHWISQVDCERHNKHVVLEDGALSVTETSETVAANKSSPKMPPAWFQQDTVCVFLVFHLPLLADPLWSPHRWICWLSTNLSWRVCGVLLQSFRFNPLTGYKDGRHDSTPQNYAKTPGGWLQYSSEAPPLHINRWDVSQTKSPKFTSQKCFKDEFCYTDVWLQMTSPVRDNRIFWLYYSEKKWTSVGHLYWRQWFHLMQNIEPHVAAKGPVHTVPPRSSTPTFWLKFVFQVISMFMSGNSMEP